MSENRADELPHASMPRVLVAFGYCVGLFALGLDRVASWGPIAATPHSTTIALTLIVGVSFAVWWMLMFWPRVDGGGGSP